MPGTVLSSYWLHFESKTLYWQGFQGKKHPQKNTRCHLRLIVILAADGPQMPCSGRRLAAKVAMKRWAPSYRHTGCTLKAKLFTGKAFRPMHTHKKAA